jgi:hypothetical protein
VAVEIGLWQGSDGRNKHRKSSYGVGLRTP